VLMDAENVGVTVGFPLLATIQYLLLDLLVFPVLHPPFGFPVEPCSTGNQNGGCNTGNTRRSNKRYWIVASKGNPTVTPTFSASINTVRLLWILSDIEVTGKSKMAAIYWKDM
jgi:hypothetical protein